jgi:hypothetical protein
VHLKSDYLKPRNGALALLSKFDPQSELQLSRIKGGSRLAERRQRIRPTSESVIRHAKVRAVEKIKSLREQIQRQAFRDLKSAAQAQVE